MPVDAAADAPGGATNGAPVDSPVDPTVCAPVYAAEGGAAEAEGYAPVDERVACAVFAPVDVGSTSNSTTSELGDHVDKLNFDTSQMKPIVDQDDLSNTGTDITGKDITLTEIIVPESSHLTPILDDNSIKTSLEMNLKPASNKDGTDFTGSKTELVLMPEICDINSNVEATTMPMKPSSDNAGEDITGKVQSTPELSLARDTSNVSRRESFGDEVGMVGVEYRETKTAAGEMRGSGELDNGNRRSAGLEMIQEDCSVDVFLPKSGMDRVGGSLFSHDSISGEMYDGPIPPVLTVVTTADPDPDPDPHCLPDAGPTIRVIPPAALALKPDPGPAPARKSPVTVQEWVDSLPPPRLREDVTPDQWNASRSSAAAASVSGSGLRREASVQSDAGSHCSSVESLLGSRRADPEEILMGLGFGGAANDYDSDVARIPRRFLRPSKVKGVAIDDFLRHQHDLVQTFESGFYGYRGLTGPGYRPPSVIVAKIMEKLRGIRPSPVTSTPVSAASGKRFSRMARKVINVLPSSVLTPDNRQFLDNQGGKSPEVPRKRMIIGQRSFTFDHDGHMIELRQPGAPTGSLSASSSDSDTSPFPKDHRPVSIAGSTEDLNLSCITRQPSEDTEPDSSCDAFPQPPPPFDMFFKPAPAPSLSSRSNSVDSSEAPTPARAWDKTPARTPFARNISTSVSSWESVQSPRAELDRTFSRYESIDEANERGADSALKTWEDVQPVSTISEDAQPVLMMLEAVEPVLPALDAVLPVLMTAEPVEPVLMPMESVEQVLITGTAVETELTTSEAVQLVLTTSTAEMSCVAEQVDLITQISSAPCESILKPIVPSENIPDHSCETECVVPFEIVPKASVQNESVAITSVMNVEVVSIQSMTGNDPNESVATERGLPISVPTSSVSSDNLQIVRVVSKHVPKQECSESGFDVLVEMYPKGIPTAPSSVKSEPPSAPSSVKSEPTERLPTTLQQRRGSLKRQQRVEEDSYCVDARQSGLSHVDDHDVSSSHSTLSEMNDVDLNDVDGDYVDRNDADTISMNSSRMEELLNPERELGDLFRDSSRVDDFNSLLGSIDIEEVEVGEGVSRKMWRCSKGSAGSLIRDRSGSSGFQDQDQDLGQEGEAQSRRELSQELVSRGLSPPPSHDAAVRLALSAYGDQLRDGGHRIAESDLEEAQHDLDTLRQLRELLSLELRRVADLLDEMAPGVSAPTLTAQMTTLLRQQSLLNHRLDLMDLDEASPSHLAPSHPSPSRPTHPPPCCDTARLCDDTHRHLEQLIEHNSRDLADIRRLLQDLVSSRT